METIIRYYVYFKNDLGLLQLHPDFSSYGYENKLQIVQQIVSNKAQYREFFILESYELRNDLY